ncbi:MAG: hypothetical protein Fur0021_36370 [Candidatus Promineifilaceae bacterium]
MKSEFLVAFNEICQSRNLSQDVVIEALKTALVSAYRRNVNASNNQQVVVEIDRYTGEPTVYAEKEVVDSIIDDRTEVRIDDARSAGYKDVELGDMVLMDSTPTHFGRIAAQTAKQVILQRVREAEREQLYEDFSAREGEIVNGTVQSISGQNITIGLGRTEATLPRGQQVSTERYRPHDKIRVYVLEVRRTNRGPQIIVSRNHRNLLRRLLELEVPEIYNGQVEIKSIAREAGARSKVAVMALQPGVDPVGACVGMRGVRIQSIVRELNDEKIDVIEWDADHSTFIAKALSPARVAQVFLEDDPEEGKTAVVIVPDDQLSLAIGREGQNARLAAKLTGWRIDIKSLTESAAESLQLLDNPAVDRNVARNKELLEQVQLVLAKKEASRPITAEDYNLLNRFVASTLGRVLRERASKMEEGRKRRAEARKRVPKEAWELPITVLDLPARIVNLLEENELNTVGDILFHIELGQAALLKLKGFGEKSLEAVQEAVAAYYAQQTAIAELETAAVEGITLPEGEMAPEAAVAGAPVAEAAVAEAAVAETAVEETPAMVEPEVVTPPAPIDNLAAPLVQPTVTKKPVSPKPTIVVVTEPAPEEIETVVDSSAARKGGKKRKGKEYVYDESTGATVTKRKRKGSRRRESWEEFGDLDDF